jgi:hypothetical protein
MTQSCQLIGNNQQPLKAYLLTASQYHTTWLGRTIGGLGQDPFFLGGHG